MKNMRPVVGVLGALTAIIAFGIDRSNAQSTIARQPGPFPDSMSTYFSTVYEQFATHDGRLVVGGWGDEYDSFIRFDLSGLPQIATSATVQIYTVPSDGGATWVQMNLSEVTGDWQSRTLSTSNAPQSTGIQSLVAPSTSGWYTIDVTTLYNSWRVGNLTALNYGIKLTPTATNNNFDIFRSSDYAQKIYRPKLFVTYTPSATDGILKLKWPLNTVIRKPNLHYIFGDDWTVNATKCLTVSGLKWYHAGTDYSATANNHVYAAEDGVVKEVAYATGWAYNIVLEHMSPTGTPYTTVYWHVNPTGDARQFLLDKQPRFIPKGALIANVADLGTKTHFHFGIRMGSYEPVLSGLGALPGSGCVDSGTPPLTYPQFPTGFVNPELSNLVTFQ